MECFQTQINYLSEPIDVYNDWIDACETANWRATLFIAARKTGMIYIILKIVK